LTYIEEIDERLLRTLQEYTDCMQSGDLERADKLYESLDALLDARIAAYASPHLP